MSVRKIVSRVYLAPIHHILTCSVVQMEVLGKKIILQHGRKFYNSYGSILYADFAARKGGSLEALELEGMVNAIFYAMNNKGCSINMYTYCQVIVKRLQGDDRLFVSFMVFV